jgi:2-oxoglutarate dehydrogenase E1 component
MAIPLFLRAQGVKNVTGQENYLQAMIESSALAGGNAAYVEELYESYLIDPNEVPSQWRDFFEQLSSHGSSKTDISHATIREQLKQISKQKGKASTAVQQESVSLEHERKQIQVLRMINAYRLQGHLHAQIDPLGMRELADENLTELTLEDHGLTVNDMGTIFDVETFVGPKQMPLGELYQALNDSYCGSIATEFMHISSPEERAWIQQRIEGSRCQTQNFRALNRSGRT